MLNTTARRIGVFIDVQNMYYSARHLFSQKVQFTNIVTECVGDAQLVRALAYAITTEEGLEEAFLNALRSQGIEVMSKELLEYHSGAKKGDWDVGITIDIVRMLDMLDVVVLVSGDGDFTPLVEYIKHKGRIAHVASFRESTSSSLVEAADIYTNLSDSPDIFLVPVKKRFGTRKSKPAPLPKASGGRIKSPHQAVMSDFESDPAQFPDTSYEMDDIADVVPAKPADIQKQEEDRARKLEF
jgi:uncharacterized LabA/DUF88 family protein